MDWAIDYLVTRVLVTGCLLPDEEKCVYGEGGVADSLEHKIPLCHRTQGFILCKAIEKVISS